jgi:cob(I)alamin adenosyltransferase
MTRAVPMTRTRTHARRVASEYCKLADNGLHVYIEEIQARLMDVGSAVATPETSATEPQKGARRVIPPDLSSSTTVSESHSFGGGVSTFLAAKMAFGMEYTEALEEWIDLLDGQLPKLTRFILPVRTPFARPTFRSSGIILALSYFLGCVACSLAA